MDKTDLANHHLENPDLIKHGFGKTQFSENFARHLGLALEEVRKEYSA